MTHQYLFSLFTLCAVFLFAGCGSSEKNDITDRMAEEHKNDSPVANGTQHYAQQQPVTTKTVAYAETDSGAIEGYYAEPENFDGDLPGIIVIHEWWGLNDNIRMMTDRLAGLGYKALAVDLYNGSTASSPDQARSLMQQAMSNKAGGVDNLEQAYSYLNETAGATKTGVIGWCFGGGWSLQTALAMPEKIDAAVMYYGQLVQDIDKLETLQMPLIGFFGGKDQGIPPKSVRTFKDNLQKAGVDADISIYENAGHAFANPSGNSFQKEAATDSWKKTKAFFNEHLKNSN